MDNNEVEDGQNDGENKEKESLLDTCARFLSEVDTKGQERALLRDANVVLEKILLPMSFPWAHGIRPIVKTVPYDIDEMYGIRIDQSASDSSGDQVDRINSMSENYYSARRSKDPGVIEFIKYTKQTLAKRSFVRQTKVDVLTSPHETVPGFFTHNMYQEVQQRKRRRLDAYISHKTTSLLSIRFGGSSSRSTIFDDVPEGRYALILPLLQPKDVVEGKRLNVSNAEGVAHNLGSYDCRHGLSTQKKQSGPNGRAPRTFAGRTRLLWTNKEVDGTRATIYRPFYRSLLTGEKLENGTHKRPRSVKLALRLNGNLVTTDEATATRHVALLDAALSDTTVENQLHYSPKTVNDSIDYALIQHEQRSVSNVSNPQCSLDLQIFHNKLQGIVPEDFDNHADWQPPVLCCVADGDGCLSVVCSRSGHFDNEKKKKMGLCSGCLRHMPKGLRNNNGECRHCKTTFISKGKECLVCGLSSGVLVEAEAGSMHEICKELQVGGVRKEARVCHLCSKCSPGVLCCASDHCQVAFHPWCARIVSQLGHISLPAEEVAKMTDSYLCTQYTVGLFDVGVTKGLHLPIVYCGFHNPKRMIDQIGLYPNCLHLDGSLRVPPQPNRNEGRGI